MQLFKMAEYVDQRICNTFCAKLDDIQLEITEKMKRVFGNEAMRTTQIKEWYRHFRNG